MRGKLKVEASASSFSFSVKYIIRDKYKPFNEERGNVKCVYL